MNKKAVFWASLLLILGASVSKSNAQTGVPYYNVTAYGAVCDGKADDAVAIQAAINAAKGAHGGVVMIPPATSGACLFGSPLDLDQTNNITILGLNESMVGNASVTTVRPTLKYTGSRSPAISARSTFGFAIKGLHVQYSNPSFNGLLIDLGHTGVGCSSGSCDSYGARFVADSIEGTPGMPPSVPPVSGATCLICGEDAINVEISSSEFAYAVTAIQGAASSGHYANVWNIRNNRFSSDTGTISEAFLKNPGYNWVIVGNTFEMGTGLGSPTILFNSGTSCIACSFIGNWIGDTATDYNGTFIKNFGTPGGLGLEISGNYFKGSGSAIFLTTTGCQGVSLHGNWFATFQTLFSLSGPVTNFSVEGNTYSGITTFLSGTPTTGEVTDIAGLKTIYGNVKVTGNVQKQIDLSTIDHPLDPANKYLSHSFVESPDMMNIYTGTIELDSRGEAVVFLPEYFEALNRDFRYQLTCIGKFVPVYVSKEIFHHQFHIAGGTPGVRISWQVTGIRKDRYAEAHRIQPETLKPEGERGHYLYQEPTPAQK